mmetsp:Transcript_8109/g.23134  ORF Transcript_8109/g.23134 Transcript_8109/m.23134 type:complete len:616 (-) Transcript_8109:82-1929(-)
MHALSLLPMAAVAFLTLPARGAPGGDIVLADEVFFTVPRTDRRLTVEKTGFAHTFWAHRGAWQRFHLEEVAPSASAVGLSSGQQVMLKAWTGGYLTDKGGRMSAKSRDTSASQVWTIKSADGSEGPIVSGSRVVLYSRHGAPVVVDDPEKPGRLAVRDESDVSRLELVIELARRRSTAASTTSTAPPTTTTTTPRACADLDAAGLASALSVKTVQLPSALRSRCPGFGVDTSCRHAFYAATPSNEAHALLYNDEERNATLLLFDGEDRLLRTRVLGTEEVRGLQFEPSGAHLVALISGGTNVWGSPSYFVKMEVPSLNIVWTKPVDGKRVGLEKWTPDNTDTIAVSETRYVLHSSGNCREGQWCAGHQGDTLQVVDAVTGEQLKDEGREWSASHSCKQMIAYNDNSKVFLYANAGDAYPQALEFRAKKAKSYYGGLRFDGWGNMAGRQGVTQGAIKADPHSSGFASVWTNGTEDGRPDKLYYAGIDSSVAFVNGPRELFPNSPGTEIGGNIAPLGPGRWLVAYNEAPSDLITDYLRIFYDNWNIPESVRLTGGRLAIINGEGAVVGEPVDVAALGAPFPVEINHLVERSDGLGWVYLDGPGKSTAKIVHLRCKRA